MGLDGRNLVFRVGLTLCLLGNLHAFLSSADFLKINFFEKNISGIPSECQTVWIEIRPNILYGLIWFQTVCKGNQQTTHKQRVNEASTATETSLNIKILYVISSAFVRCSFYGANKKVQIRLSKWADWSMP